jgi:HPt (histidine-containing phosphotransfer) domain-containing protein
VLKEPIKTADVKGSGFSQTDDDDDTNSVFSIKLAKEFTGNDEELAYELFDMLRAELGSYKEAILLALESNDLVKLREAIHKLHGASRCCGTTELKQSSSHIETMIMQNINFDIEKEIAVLLSAIKNVADYKINKDI